ncbi:hypothetical protein A9P82_01210 [Arachidicoccus ginsenosidimutans]|uniref:ComF family protein n=1 Tax=Arachidicoccus sp. BS20 TaxID=1850526 RepID=UPI0007F0FB06|nr:phosphoribosyltransferase family protein [Arachidicoccus sp. BS20]ANI88059.1 hypothetical protein A9P82_01210 [Arachidicoccus sp. BS20]
MPLFRDLLDMIYPRYCVGCDALLENEEVLCVECMDELPYTDFFQTDDNPVKEIFFGRIKVEHAGSLLFYEKDSLVQRLIFDLKYKSNKNAGTLLGALLANNLRHLDWLKEIDMILPLPLHKKREQQRGYNQAIIIGEQLSEELEIPMNTKVLERTVHTETQTHKTRELRWQSMQHIFKTKDNNILQGKHVLLIDDVLTTGATLEVCGSEILKVQDTKLSIATAAYAIE